MFKIRIYVNFGYWCDSGDDDNKDDNAHFIETDDQIVQLSYLEMGQL